MKDRVPKLIAGLVMAGTLAAAAPVSAEQPSAGPPSRVALVIGEGAYRSGALPAAPNDAGLLAETLAGAGFDVTGARDLDGEGLRRAVRDFLEKAGTAGPDGIALVYLAGRALQFDGDNFFEPIDARLARPADLPIETLRLGDLSRALAALPIQAKVVVVDGAYAGGPQNDGSPPGLALVEAEQGELLAFNAAPGTVAPATTGPYGIYARSFVEAMKQGGVPVEDLFDRLRLSVASATGGSVVPWESDKLTRSFKFFERAASAPLMDSAQIPFSALQKKPLRDFPADQAFDVAIARDTLPAYGEFLAAFPESPQARRVRLLQAIRREALFWTASVHGGTPQAFWTYLARYSRGPHAAEAHRRLSRLAAAALPPPGFAPLAFDVPPPPEAEVIVFARPLAFEGPEFPAPPRPPVFLLPPPVETVLPPPPRPAGPGFLPVPIPVAVPGVRVVGDAGTILPPRGVRGSYPRPRPFARGPNGEGLVIDRSLEPPAASRPSITPDQGRAAGFPPPMPAAAAPPDGVFQHPPGIPLHIGTPIRRPTDMAKPLPGEPRLDQQQPGQLPVPETQPKQPGLPQVSPPVASTAPGPRPGKTRPSAPVSMQPGAPVGAVQDIGARHERPVHPVRPNSGPAPGREASPPASQHPPVGAIARPPVTGPPAPHAAADNRPVPVQAPRPLPQPRPGAQYPAEGPRLEAGQGRRAAACGHPGAPACHP